MSLIKISPHPNGGLPPEPFDGDVYLVRYRASKGNVASKLFWTYSFARAWFDEVIAAGGLPVMHRSAAVWQECGPVPAVDDRDAA